MTSREIDIGLREAGVRSPAAAIPWRSVLGHRRHKRITRSVPLALLFATALGVAMAVPFAYGLLAAMMSPADVMARSPSYWPLYPGNFLRVFQTQPFGLFLLNSLVIALTTTAGTMATAVLGAYAFGRMAFRGRDALFGFVVGAVMIPDLIGVIPNYLFMAHLGLLPGYCAAILPTLASGFATFFLRQHIRAIPREYEEAARIDGASRLKILFDVIVPLSRPAIASMALFVFLKEWNAYLWPLIVLEGDQRTVQIGLANLQHYAREQPLTDWPLILAASMVVLVPSFIAFVVAEKQLVRGVGLSGIK